MAYIIGEAPSKSGDKYHSFPLSGAVGEKLCTMAGLEPDAEGSRYGRFYWALREAFDCMNLIERYPGAQGDGAAFPIIAARARCLEVWPELRGGVIVLLGARLNAVFGLMIAGRKHVTPHFFEWAEVEETMFVTIPHPSGLNRLYNADEMKTQAGIALREAIFWAGLRSAA